MVEIRHRLEGVIGKPEVNKHGRETIHEPPHPGNRPTVDDIVGLGAEWVVEGDSRQVGGPDRQGIDGLGRRDYNQ